jgi:hypothetical protein
MRRQSWQVIDAGAEGVTLRFPLLAIDRVEYTYNNFH